MPPCVDCVSRFTFSVRFGILSGKLNYVLVSGIKPLGRQPVYNMEVDEYQNFSVNGGIIVHNCMDATRYFAKTMRLVQKNNKKQRKSIFDGAQQTF